MTKEEKAKLFKEELELIQDVKIREFVKEVFDLVPDHGFTTPAATSGKYHPKDEHGYLGNVIHAKRVVKWVLLFARAYDITSQKHLDILIASAIIHDLGKAGFGDVGSNHTLKEHASLMMLPISNAAAKVKLGVFKTMRISGCVLYHNGRWTEEKFRKSRGRYNKLEWCLHLADYTASKMGDVI